MIFVIYTYSYLSVVLDDDDGRWSFRYLVTLICVESRQLECQDLQERACYQRMVAQIHQYVLFFQCRKDRSKSVFFLNSNMRMKKEKKTHTHNHKFLGILKTVLNPKDYYQLLLFVVRKYLIVSV